MVRRFVLGLERPKKIENENEGEDEDKGCARALQTCSEPGNHLRSATSIGAASFIVMDELCLLIAHLSWTFVPIIPQYSVEWIRHRRYAWVVKKTSIWLYCLALASAASAQAVDTGKSTFIVPVCVALAVFAATAGPAQTTLSAWDWTTASPESQGLSTRKLKSMTDALAARSTSGLLVIRNDAIVCEWYAPGAGTAIQHGTASMAKAIVGGVAAAVAVTDGRVALKDRVAKFIPQWQADPRKSRITFRQLGSHTSGLADAEDQDLPHEKLSGWRGDFWKRIKPPLDPFTIARDLTPTLFEPGEKYQYSNPGIGMLVYALTAALKDAPQKDIRTLLRERVMRPIGVPDAEWSIGYNQTITVDGLPLVAAWGGGSYTARAVARIGQLMLRQGDWNGKQLLSREAVRLVTSDFGSPSACGIGWWSNNQGRCARVPKDGFWGSGAGHQVMLVVPSLKLVAVRNGQALPKMPASTEFNSPLFQWIFEPLMDAITEQNP
jgi:CubicO group peptidase (beta-lactamase class C family)